VNWITESDKGQEISVHTPLRYAPNPVTVFQQYHHQPLKPRDQRPDRQQLYGSSFTLISRGGKEKPRHVVSSLVKHKTDSGPVSKARTIWTQPATPEKGGPGPSKVIKSLLSSQPLKFCNTSRLIINYPSLRPDLPNQYTHRSTFPLIDLIAQGLQSQMFYVRHQRNFAKNKATRITRVHMHGGVIQGTHSGSAVTVFYCLSRRLVRRGRTTVLAAISSAN
jgi:hypothetical protein